MVFIIFPNSLTLSLCIGVKGNTDYWYSQYKMKGSKEELQDQNQEKQIRLLAYLFLIQAEFILVRQVKNVLKCIIMTMPFGSSTRIF